MLDWLCLVFAGVAFYLFLSNLNYVLGGVQALLGILSPFAGGVVIAFVLDPLVETLHRAWMRGNPKLRWAAILLAYLTALLLLGLLGWLVLPQIGSSFVMLFTSLPGYIAGVRDTLLHRRPNDWDVATAAAPEAVTELFERTVPTGIRHGTVTVLYGGSACEVTTYRVEGAYSDHRRPDSVRFTSRLEEDLSRRDFTINAMAMDASLAITDPFGGREDLSRRLIRCVGDARERFTEDALRMLRAVRFAAQLDFALDSAALEAIAGCAPLCSALSPERVAPSCARCSPRETRTWSGSWPTWGC